MGSPWNYCYIHNVEEYENIFQSGDFSEIEKSVYN